MNLSDTPELAGFRALVREWLAANYTPEKADPYTYGGVEAVYQDPDAFYRKLAGKGWLAFRWPAEYGGTGWNAAQQLVFMDEIHRAGAPIPKSSGLTLVGPLIYQFGTDAQKKRFLPPIARHGVQWCQGYSEPNAGSDLANLQTRAELQGDHFVVNGQKIWTSRAHKSDWIFALVRTDPNVPKQKGISFLLMDMKTPGITTRPIRQIDGQSGFCETFFDNVRVPAEQIVGKIDEGWTMAKALLGHERAYTGYNLDLAGMLARTRRLGRQYGTPEQRVWDDPGFSRAVTQLEMDADCQRYTRYRTMTAVMQGRAPGPESSILKLAQAKICQGIFDAGRAAIGSDALAWFDTRLDPDAFDLPMGEAITRAMSIYSGSDEVQRNIIGKRVLGLPD
jgi:alkylation response protein AidB-like acyl-CoA dehydrogenase